MSDYHPSESRVRRDVSQTPNSSSQTIIREGGAMYTRWGRTECPSGSDAVYSGIAGGLWFDHTGGGSNYLCLPTDPIWGQSNEGVEKYSKLFGAEYEGTTGIDLTNMRGRPAQDNNVPCVVCRSQTKTSVVMIPARNLCYDDWTLEYADTSCLQLLVLLIRGVLSSCALIAVLKQIQRDFEMKRERCSTTWREFAVRSRVHLT